jgi:hypothetical protein
MHEMVWGTGDTPAIEGEKTDLCIRNVLPARVIYWMSSYQRAMRRRFEGARAAEERGKEQQ